jgi:hypothetical protein
VESLEEMGYVVKRDDDSIILTEKGVLYIISKRPRQYVLPILENYSEIYPDFKRYLQLSEELGHKLFLKIANNLFNSHELMDKKADRRKAVSIGLSLASIFSDEFSDEERGKIIKAILKVYPEFNEPFKENMKQLASFWLESDSN